MKKTPCNRYPIQAAQLLTAKIPDVLRCAADWPDCVQVELARAMRRAIVESGVAEVDGFCGECLTGLPDGVEGCCESCGEMLTNEVAE